MEYPISKKNPRQSEVDKGELYIILTVFGMRWR